MITKFNTYNESLKDKMVGPKITKDNVEDFARKYMLEYISYLNPINHHVMKNYVLKDIIQYLLENEYNFHYASTVMYTLTFTKEGHKPIVIEKYSTVDTIKKQIEENTINESLKGKLKGKSKQEILDALDYDPTITFKSVKNIAGGTWLQGSYVTTYNTLVKVFGKPIPLFDFDSNYEWLLIDNNGNIVKIYDRHVEFDAGVLKNIAIDWHIGGKNKKDANNVIGYIIQNTM